MPDSFLLSQDFIGKIRSTIDRVDGTPLPGDKRSPIPTVIDGGGQSPRTFRIGTFDGAWTKGSTKTVTLTHSGTSATVTATNLFVDVNSAANSGVNCALAKDGGTWYLIASEC